MKAVRFPDRNLSPKMKKIVLSGLTALTLLPSLTAAPALETLLPAETVAVVAVPDYAGAEKMYGRSTPTSFIYDFPCVCLFSFDE